MSQKCDKKHELYWRPTNVRRDQMQFNRPGDMALGIRLFLGLQELTEHCVACAANRPGQEVLCVLWRPKTCYRIRNSPTLTAVLIQMNQVPCRSHCFHAMCFNIIFLGARVFDGLLFPLSFPINMCYALLVLSVTAAIRPLRLPLRYKHLGLGTVL